MVKPFLILMLVATQLLAGSGVSIHLCVGGDGLLCCFDAGPAGCGCCKGHAEPEPTCEDHSAAEEADECGSGCCRHHRGDPPAEEKRPPALTDISCSCTHVPLVLSSDEPAMATRAEAAASKCLDGPPVLYLPVSQACSGIVSSPPPLPGSSPSGSLNHALVVISTVVLRC